MARKTHHEADGAVSCRLEILTYDDGISHELKASKEDHHVGRPNGKEFGGHFFATEESEDLLTEEDGKRRHDENPRTAPTGCKVENLLYTKMVLRACIEAEEGPHAHCNA